MTMTNTGRWADSEELWDDIHYQVKDLNSIFGEYDVSEATRSELKQSFAKDIKALVKEYLEKYETACERAKIVMIHSYAKEPYEYDDDDDARNELMDEKRSILQEILQTRNYEYIWITNMFTNFELKFRTSGVKNDMLIIDNLEHRPPPGADDIYGMNYLGLKEIRTADNGKTLEILFDAYY